MAIHLYDHTQPIFDKQTYVPCVYCLIFLASDQLLIVRHPLSCIYNTLHVLGKCTSKLLRFLM